MRLKRSVAAVKDAQIKLRKEDYALGMGHRSHANNAAVKVATIMLSKEESVGGMGQIAVLTMCPLLLEQNSTGLRHL